MAFTVQATTAVITAPAALTAPRYTTGTDDTRGSFVLEIDPRDRSRTWGLVDARGRGKLHTSTDGMASGNTLVWDANAGVANGAQEIMHARFLPNGELAVSVRNQYSGDGGMYVSTGLPGNPAGATWARTLTWSQPGNYASTYGLDAAPAGHIREGLVVVAEYGAQSVQGVTSPDAGASRVWVSTDYGRTWREVFNLLRTYGTKNQHMHGCAYDPWNDNLIVCFGDGYAGAPALSGILYAEDWQGPAAATWRPIVAPASQADGQATLIKPLPGGVLVGSDGGPDGVWFLGRNPKGGYSPPRSVLMNPRGSCIATQAYQASPAHPTFLVFRNGQANPDYVRVFMVSPSGDRIDEVWCDTTAPAPVWGGPLGVVGPDAAGHVFLTAEDSRSKRTLTRLTLGPAPSTAAGGGTATDVTVTDLTTVYNTAKA